MIEPSPLLSTFFANLDAQGGSGLDELQLQVSASPVKAQLTELLLDLGG